MHVGYDAIGNDQQDKVVFAIEELRGNSSSAFDNRREIGRAVEADGGKAVAVVGDDVGHVTTVWVQRIGVQWELMRDQT